MTTIRTGNRRHRKKMLRQHPAYAFFAYMNRLQKGVMVTVRETLTGLMPLIYDDKTRDILSDHLANADLFYAVSDGFCRRALTDHASIDPETGEISIVVGNKSDDD